MRNCHEDWTIVLFASRGLAAFVENALIGIARCGIAGSLVQVVFPANAEPELGPLVKTFGARQRLLEDIMEVRAGDMPEAYLEWGSTGFFLLLKYPLPARRAILAEGTRVIYSDVDVAWLRNPLPYLSDALQHYPWACQTEPSIYFPPNFCVRFFALSGARECFEIIDLHIAQNVGDALKQPNQTSFRNTLIDNPRYLAKVFPLPEGLFPAGLLYRSVGAGDEPPVPMVDQLRPFIFHGNWCFGLEHKQRLLAHSGAWFVADGH